MRRAEATLWPVWTVPVVLAAGAFAVAPLLALALVVPLALFDPGEAANGLVVGLAFGMAYVGLVALAGRLVGAPHRLADLGLRAPTTEGVLGWLTLAALLGVAFAFFWVQVVDLSLALALPPEFDDRSVLEEQLAGGRAASGDPSWLTVVASALGRVVITAVTAEVVLCGFVGPVLNAWRGPVVAVPAVAVGWLAPVAFAAGGTLPGELVPLALLLGVLTGALGLGTASLLPGLALSAAGLGTIFAAAAELGWVAGTAVVLSAALVTPAAAFLAAALGPGRLRRGPRRRRR